MKEKNHQSEENSLNETGPDGINQVRELLFGGAMRDTEKRLIKLEERVNQELNRYHQEQQQMFKNLEDFIKNQIGLVGNQLKNEQTDRQEKERKLQEAIDNGNSRLSKQIDDSIQFQREIRQLIMDQGKQLSNENKSSYQQIRTRLDDEIANLTDKKTDRKDLAAMLTDIVLRLNNDSAQDSD